MGRILLLIELKGGNDGLNTVIPYADPKYRELRPGIGVARDHTIQLDEKVGLHNKLEPLMESWKAGDLAIVQGVGYPYPNRSHFRSIEIWDTASASNQTLSEGWIAQAFKGAALPKGVGVDSIVVDTNALPSTGPELRTIVMQDAENFLRQAHALKDTGGMKDGSAMENPALRHLLAVRQEINGAAKGLADKLRAAAAPKEAYPQEVLLGRQLDLATRIVTARVPVVAIKAALGGFDTHANQVQPHERLLGFLATNLATLRKNLIAANLWNDVRGDDLLGVRPPRPPERQRRHRPRHGGAAVRDGRRREGRPARRLSVARRSHRRRPQAHRRLPQRVCDGGAGLLGPAARFRAATAAEAGLPVLRERAPPARS